MYFPPKKKKKEFHLTVLVCLFLWKLMNFLDVKKSQHLNMCTFEYTK